MLQTTSAASDLRVAVVGLQAEWRLWGSTLMRRCDGKQMRGDGGGGQCVCPLDVYEMRSLAREGQACQPSIGLRVIIRLPGCPAAPWLLVSHSFDLAGDIDGLFGWIAEHTGRPPQIGVDMRTDRDTVPGGTLSLVRVPAAQPYLRPVLALGDVIPLDKLPAPPTGDSHDDQGAPPVEHEVATEGAGNTGTRTTASIAAEHGLPPDPNPDLEDPF